MEVRDSVRKWVLDVNGLTFVVAGDGRVLAGMRWLAAEAEVPGLGARHRALAGMTSLTGAVGVAVSGEDEKTRVFKGGEGWWPRSALSPNLGFLERSEVPFANVLVFGRRFSTLGPTLPITSSGAAKGGALPNHFHLLIELVTLFGHPIHQPLKILLQPRQETLESAPPNDAYQHVLEVALGVASSLH